MKASLAILLVFSGLAAGPSLATAQIPAFSGAEGAGALATGGRPKVIQDVLQGEVYHVTTLDPDPTGTTYGSLRYGMSDGNFYVPALPGLPIFPDIPATFDVKPRIIVFDVGGTIVLDNTSPNSDIDMTPRNFTLAGQTAPGGITIYGAEFNPGHRENWDTNGTPSPTNNLVIRNLAVRTHNPNEKDGFWVPLSNSIVDHVSTSWYTDEGVSITDGARDITLQHSLIGPGWNSPDGDGSQIEGKTPMADISVHHNLYIHNDARNPRTGEKVGPGVELDFRNNVIYNWNDSRAGYSGGGEPSFNNFVNNYYIGGPGNSTGDNIFSSADALTRIYQSGNFLDLDRNGIAGGTDPGWSRFAGSEAQVGTPYSVPHGVTQSAAEALATVQGYVGARWWDRDFLDERSLAQLATFGQGTVAQTGQVLTTVPAADVSAVTGAPLETRPAGYDSDSDGMPDEWELRHGLNPNSPVGDPDWILDYDNDGYVNVEEFINELAEWPAPYDIVFTGGTNARYEQITNWSIARPSPGEANTTTHWQPSRFDVAAINNASVTLDAVGQHAGTLKIAAGAGDAARLDITGGWLRVEDELVIGTNLSQGTLNLSGGLLSTHTLSTGSGGSFNFTGGTLQADVVNFDLVNNGGTIAPGQSPGLTVINGDLTLKSGVLEIEIGGTQFGQYDRLEVHGVTELGGTLKVELVELNTGPYVPQLGDTFGFLAAFGGGGGEFDAFDFPQLATGLRWAVLPGDVTIFLSVVAAPEMAGDYNDDGTVDAADYVVWRDGEGTTNPLPNDPIGGTIGQTHFEQWRANFGRTAGAGSVGLAAGASAKANGAVPEPSGLLTAVIFAANLPIFLQKFARRRMRAN